MRLFIVEKGVFH